MYSISVSGLVFAALAVCHYCTQQIRHAETYRRPLARSRTLWCHTTSKAIPSLCPWRTINKYTGTLVCTLSPFWVCVRRAHRVPLLHATVRTRLDITVRIRRYTARCGATLQAKQHPPYVPGERSTNIRVHLCVFYLRFWACVRRVSRVSPLHASIGEVHNLNTTKTN